MPCATNAQPVDTIDHCEKRILESVTSEVLRNDPEWDMIIEDLDDDDPLKAKLIARREGPRPN